ncbi:RNA polymerase I-specific transcription initiation factor RRN3 [Rhizoctonia solani 123E]|uniref:RNA polymerase I-specific transcription initiation factor RRN3 n=1 Tax=Rhizoctonia solani 123E TaxID=1423351 RepID=A0A074SZV1_9AGAM|nr:RNA polymerase I-specific transcription initiation factor RRN3 [Rhizoctonia solani 123E]
MKPPAHVPSTKALADQHARYHLKQAPMLSRESSESRKRRLDLDDVATKSSRIRPVAPQSRSLKRDDSFRKDMYLTFVRNALKERLKGNSEPFHELVGQFGPAKLNEAGAGSTVRLRAWVTALSHVVSSLERSHAPLVEAMLATPWMTLDDAFAVTYTNFIGVLVSARPEYLASVLSRCVQGFTYQSYEALERHSTESSTPLTRRVICNRVHNLLSHLLGLIPTLPLMLQPILTSHFPHKKLSKLAQTTYIRNLLTLSGYCPALSDAILSLIIERAQQIDVEIQVELEDLDDDNGPETGDIFNLDGFDNVIGEEDPLQNPDVADEDEGEIFDGLSDISSEDGDLAEDDVVEGPSNVKHIQDMVSKLDAVLTLVFEHLAATPMEPLSIFSWPSTGQISPLPATPERQLEIRHSQLWNLIAIFKRTIVKTHKSRYTQFLLFWYSSLHADFTDVFLGVLMDRLMDPTLPDMARVGAASYVASFISRAKHIDTSSARAVVSVLCDYLRDTVDKVEDLEARSSDFTPVVSQYALFYAITQAIFLIYCFRWRELGEDPDELLVEGDESPKLWMPELLVVQRAIMSALNPLKICAINVVQQFARVSNSTGFVYCFTILESNRRSDLTAVEAPPPQHGARLKIDPKHARLSRDPALDVDLNAFFPFDPYKLPVSHKYIDDVYREWSSVALEEDSDSDDDETEALQESQFQPPVAGDESEGDNGDDDESESSSVTSTEPPGIPILGSTDLLDASFGGMSISPGARR